MVDGRVQRRLAAILAADVVGYSRLMEADEDQEKETNDRWCGSLFDGKKKTQTPDQALTRKPVPVTQRPVRPCAVS
jgi:hypothetical protein